MIKTILTTLLLSSCISTGAFAGIEEALKAYEQKNYPQAFEEFSYLADENNNIASYHLGLMYQNGQGVEKSISTAAQYYLKAYKAGNMSAGSKLGQLLISGTDIEKNVDNGIDILKTAGRSGNKEALYTLGELYSEGNEVDKDYVFASGYMRLSALQGYAPAQHKLGLLYLYGRGVPQDYSATKKWILRAASQGYVPAQKDIAELYETNKRMANLVDAYKWYSIIAAYNTDDTGTWATDKRDQVANKITDNKNFAIAQDAAAKWKPISATDSVPELERSDNLPIIPGFNDKETLKRLNQQNAIVLADGSDYGILTDDVDQALIKKDTAALEEKIEGWGKNGRPDAYTYWGKIVEYRMQDTTKALDWYKKAAEAGDAEGAYYTARAYCENKLPDSTTALCYKWLSLAKSSAKEPLLSLVNATIDEVESQLTPEEKAQLPQMEANTPQAQKERLEKIKLF